MDPVLASPDGQSRVSRATLAAQVEDAIRLDIISGMLEPGRRLRAAELSQRYGVSATPLREALQHLAAQNLVALGPRLGATVAPVSRHDLEEIYGLRQLLEARALVASIEHGGDTWELDVTQAYEALMQSYGHQDSNQAYVMHWSKVHRAFHDAILEASDAPWLLRFIGTLEDHSERYRILSLKHASRKAADEHRKIYDAVIARDTPRAVEALHDHLQRTVDVLRQSTMAEREA